MFEKFANTNFTKKLSGVSDIVPNINSTETRSRFDLDTNDWNIPKMTHQFYVLFHINRKAMPSIAFLPNLTVIRKLPKQALSDYMDDEKFVDKKFQSMFWESVKLESDELSRTASKMVKSCDKPTWKTDIKTYNQYNRKRLVNGKVHYDPIKITFHDDVKSSINKLLFYQLCLYDSSYILKAKEERLEFSQLDRFLDSFNDYGWGADIYSNTNIFDRIQIIEWYRDKCTFFTLHNPKIMNVNYKGLSLNNSDTGEISIQFDYEGLDNWVGDLKGTLANLGVSFGDDEPMLGASMTPEIAEAVRAKFENNSQSIIKGIKGAIDMARGGASFKDIASNAANSFGFGEELDMLKKVASIPKNIKKNGLVKTAWNEISNPASITGTISSSKKMTGFFKG